jgi:hypothetical protein
MAAATCSLMSPTSFLEVFLTALQQVLVPVYFSLYKFKMAACHVLVNVSVTISASFYIIFWLHNYDSTIGQYVSPLYSDVSKHVVPSNVDRMWIRIRSIALNYGRHLSAVKRTGRNYQFNTIEYIQWTVSRAFQPVFAI